MPRARFEPGAEGCEAWTLPLCYAAAPPNLAAILAPLQFLINSIGAYRLLKQMKLHKLTNFKDIDWYSAGSSSEQWRRWLDWTVILLKLIKIDWMRNVRWSLPWSVNKNILGRRHLTDSQVTEVESSKFTSLKSDLCFYVRTIWFMLGFGIERFQKDQDCLL